MYYYVVRLEEVLKSLLESVVKKRYKKLFL